MAVKDIKASNQKNMTFGDLTTDTIGSGLWKSELDAFMDAQTLKSTFFNEDWVFIVVDMLAEHISASPMILKRETATSDGYVQDIVHSHPFYELMERPNPFQDYSSWQYNWAVEYLLMGNAIEWVSDSNRIAVVIPAETVMLDFNQEGQVTGYLVSSSLDSVLGSKNGLTLFDVKNIFHQMRPNPSSLLWGLSPFLPARKSILFNRYTTDYLNNFYLRGATPSIILKMDRNIGEDSALRFLRSFESAHTGRRNTRRPLMLPKGVDFEIASHAIADQQIIDLTDKNKDKILAALKVPKHAVSMAENGSLGSAEHKAALRFFFQSAVMPIQSKRAKFLTMKFREKGFLKPNEFIEFDNSKIEFVQDDLLRRAELGEKLLNQWTINEIRQEIWQKDPIDGGDELPGRVASPQLPFFSLPQNSNLTPSDPVGQKKDPINRSSIKAAVEAKYKEWLEVNQKAIGRIVVDKELTIEDQILNMFATQYERLMPIVLIELDKTLKKGQEKSRFKDENDRPKNLDVDAIKQLLGKELQALRKEFEGKDVEDFTEVLNPLADKAYGTMILPTIAPDRIDALTVLRDTNKDGRRTVLESRALETFARIDENTTENIMKTISKGVEDRKTILEIADDIKLTASSLSKSRARTIARTETLTAVSIGKASAIKDMVEVFEGEKILKIWMTSKDEKVRETHQELDGQTIESNQIFDNGLEYPRDVNGKPEEVINCRCDVMAIPETNFNDLQINASEFGK